MRSRFALSTARPRRAPPPTSPGLAWGSGEGSAHGTCRPDFAPPVEQVSIEVARFSEYRERLSRTLSLPGTGRGDRAKRGGRGCRTLLQRGKDSLQNPFEISVDLGIPEAEYGESVGLPQALLALGVMRHLPMSSMLAAVDLDHEAALQADEVEYVSLAWRLTPEVIAAFAPAPEVDPELHFLRRHCSAQSPCLFAGHGELPLASPPTTRLRRAVPPPRSGEGLASLRDDQAYHDRRRPHA